MSHHPSPICYNFLMRRLSLFLFLSLFLSFSCRTLTPAPAPTLTVAPTARPTALPTPAPTPTLEPTPAPPDLYIEPGDVLVHPDAAVYSGDLVSFEVFAHDGANMNLSGFGIAIYQGEPIDSNRIAVESAYPAGLGGRLQATFTWVWNTTGLEGPQTITAVLDPTDRIQIGDENTDNNVLAFTVDLLPRASLPALEQIAAWRTAESACCVFNYISGTAAERDIESIKAAADKAMSAVEEKMGRKPPGKTTFNLINRLLGHGGFASDSVTVTYLDRNYAGGNLENVFKHEATHILDREIGGSEPSLITEGLATYIAGGHFKSEPYEPRMVGLLALDGYVPLTQLADDFYHSQHETGYLEGAAFIGYLVETYGWNRFVTLRGSFQSAASDSAMLDGGLRLTYDRSLVEMESEWLATLRAQPVDVRWQNDVADTLRLYDTIRRYQQADDLSAYFLNAWIPDIGRAVREDIVADYTRHPSAPENIAIETILIDAYHALAAGDYALAERDLDAVNAVLDADGDFAADPFAADYLALTHSALDAGYEPQRIARLADRATVTAIQLDSSPALIELQFTRDNGVWRVN